MEGREEVGTSADTRNLAVQIKRGARENGSQREVRGGRRGVSFCFVL